MRSLRQFLILGLFVLVALLAFSNTLNSYFLSDDFAQIGKVLSGDFSVTWGQAQGGFFRPLFILSYVVDARIWGARVFGFHLTNVLVHALNSFLVFLLSQQLTRDLKLDLRTKRVISIGAAALFLLHPSHTEAVTWISGRADLLATFFSLASVFCYVAYTKNTRKFVLLTSLACFALALLAKESAICLPFLLLVITLGSENARGERISARSAKVIALFGSILIAFIGVRARFIGSVVGGYGVRQHLNFSPGWLRDRLLEASLPAQWSFFLFKPLQSRLFIALTLAFLGLVTAAIIFRRGRYDLLMRRSQNRFVLMLAALFLASLLPVISLRLSLYQTLGERFLYLPLVFSCLLVAYLFAVFISNSKTCLLVLICVLGLYATSLYQTNVRWREAAQLSRSIMEDIVNSATQDRLLILNAPDNLRGIPVFHNGLPEALQYFQSQKPIKETTIIAFQDLQSATDRLELNRQGDLLTLRAEGAFDRITSSECLEVVTHSSQFLELRTNPCSSKADLLVFDDGMITKLPN